MRLTANLDPEIYALVKAYAEKRGLTHQVALAALLTTGALRAAASARYADSPRGRKVRRAYRERRAMRDRWTTAGGEEAATGMRERRCSP